MFEQYFITKHVLEQYSKRCKCSLSESERRIRKDLRFTKAKKIVNIGPYRYVFTEHSKEFIFVRNHNRENAPWVLRTIIKRSRFSNNEAINKRLKEQKVYYSKSEVTV